MKVTWVKGNGGSHKMIELQSLVEMLKNEKRKNCVLSLRQSSCSIMYPLPPDANSATGLHWPLPVL